MDQFIESYIEDNLTSDSNTFVAFDGTASILYKGDLVHCYVFVDEYYRKEGFLPAIYSIEAYYKLYSKIISK